VLFAFILLHFFDLLSLQRQHPLPWSESELTIPGTKVPRNIRFWERKFPGTFVPRSESSREFSFLGAKVPTGNFRSEERKYRGAKSPDTALPWRWCFVMLLDVSGYGQNGDKPKRRHAKTATPKRRQIVLTKTATN